MTNISPLLEKARTEKRSNGFRLPRRGRIRFVLVVIIGFSAVWWYKSHSRSPQKSGADRKEKIANPRYPAKEKAPERPKESLQERSVHAKRPKINSYDDVCAFIRLYPPRLTHAQDTFHFRDGAYVVHYSIDTALQKNGRELFRQYHPKYGAVTVLQPSTGRILALISYTRQNEESLGSTLFCRSIFPAASIFKTIAAAAAIEKAGLRGESMLQTYGANHTLYNSQLRKELPDFREVSFQEAYAYSINPVFARVGLFVVGAKGLSEYATKFGFNADVPFELHIEKPVFICPDSSFAVAEVASGFNQATTISPVFGALIAAAVSNNGCMVAPTLVDSITDPESGKRIFTRTSVVWRMPIRKSTAEEMVGLMKEVARYGTARKSFRYIKQSDRFKEIDYGGKTGSVDKDSLGKVDWFVGFCRHKNDKTQHVTTGVVTVHDAFWTVHSSFIGAEMMRSHIRKIQIARKEQKEAKALAETVSNDSVARKIDEKM